jgi:hypothetical protein
MCAAPIVKYLKKKRYIALAVVSLDWFLGTLIISDLGWFLFLVELIALIIVYRRSIDEFALDYIEFGTLGPIDKITGMIPVRHRTASHAGDEDSKLPDSYDADSQ